MAGEGLAVDAAFGPTEAGAADGDFDAAGDGLESGVPGRGYCPELLSDGTDTTGSLGEDSSVARRLSFSSGVGDSSCAKTPADRAARNSAAVMASDFISSVVLVRTARSTAQAHGFPAATLASVADSGQERFDTAAELNRHCSRCEPEMPHGCATGFGLTLSLAPEVRSLHRPAC